MKMNSVVDGLRQTSKGRLVYNRKIEGRALTDLLKKCASVPTLSSPHNEFIPEDPVRSASFGLGYGEDVDEEDTSHVCLHVDHQYTTSDDQCGCGEKGEQDLLQKESLPQGVSEGPVLSSLGSGQWGKGSCSPSSPNICCSPHVVSPQSPKYKHPQIVSSGDSQATRPKGFQAASPKSPQSHKSPQIVSPKSPQTLSPKQPVSPKSPHIGSPKSPHIASPIDPQIVSPKSPRVSSPKSPSAWSYGMMYCIEEGSPPVAIVSAAPLKDKEDIGALESMPVTDHVQWTQNASGDSESGLLASCEQEEEIDDTVHEDLRASFIEKMHVIVELEVEYDNKSKEVMEGKQLEFLSHQTHLDAHQRELVSRMEQWHQDSQLQESIEKQQQSKRPDIQKAVQKVKETHQHCSHRQNARLQQLEQLSQHLKEEKAKREQALEQKLQEVRAMAQKVTANKTIVINTLDQCPHKQHLSEVAEKTKLLVRKLSEQAEGLAGGLTRSGPLDEVLTRLKQFHEQSQNALDFVHNLTAEAEKKAKAAAEAERQKQQAAQAAQAALTQPPQAGHATPTSQGGQTAPTAQAVAAGEEGALAAVAKEYEKNVKLLSQIDATIDPFINDQQMKKMRFDLQRAVNTPVNAISPVSSEHLRDKLLRLRCLLRGETVEVLGKRVSAHAVPQGLAFCKNLVAKMIVRKADEQVSSSHESAFAIAAVAVGLWTEFPEVGDLIMAHLQALCPYVLPFYPPRLPNQSSEEYHKTLGYKIVNGNIEQQDKFLKRMSGILRLYAAIMVTSPPQGAHLPHPHSLEHAWVWLARSMNLQPNPDITATAIYDMLHVTGGFLLRAYRVQFVKLLYFLYKVFLPKLKNVAAGSGPVSRLEIFLDTTMKNNAQIPDPEGYLPPHFWRS